MSLCTLCAHLGKTCCQKTDVLLTPDDIERIRAHTGSSDFFENRHPRDPGCLGGEDDPNWLLYTVHTDGSRTVVCHSRDGDCLFLAAEGCSLPCDVRPLICRLHPLVYTESGIVGTSDDCPVRLLRGEDLLRSIGMDFEAGLRWHRQLYAELDKGRGVNRHGAGPRRLHRENGPECGRSQAEREREDPWESLWQRSERSPSAL